MTSRAAKWARRQRRKKHASYLDGMMGPVETEHSPFSSKSITEQFLAAHFPTQYARETVAKDPTVSFADKVRINAAINYAASLTSPKKDTTQLSNLIPALVGAGLGYIGAALAAPIFGLSPAKKKIFGISGAALGAVLNTVGRGTR